MTQRYAEFYRRSIDERDAFWAEQAQMIDWQRPFDRVLELDASLRSLREERDVLEHRWLELAEAAEA